MFIDTDEGYVSAVYPEGIDSEFKFQYVYNHTDHLGNIRQNITRENGNLTVLREHNYYPFGLLHKGYNEEKEDLKYDKEQDFIFTVQAQAGRYKYRYNGKEWQDDLGLNWYDYGARSYDAAVGRWFVVDPLAEKYYGMTPYNYGENDPIRHIDIDGKKSDDWFVNKKTGALVYIEGEHQLNEETAKKAFGEQQADLIFNNEKNDYSNWERLGDDTMFDTEDDKVSENKTMYVPESVAEDFANKREYSLAIKTDVTEEINSQYFNHGYDNKMSFIHNEPVEKEIHNQGFTYIKSSDQKATIKLEGRVKRNFSRTGWDQMVYRKIKIQKIEQRDFTKFYNQIHLKKGPIDIQLEKTKK